MQQIDKKIRQIDKNIHRLNYGRTKYYSRIKKCHNPQSRRTKQTKLEDNSYLIRKGNYP